MAFNSNVSVIFVYAIHSTIFDYGSLLNVNEQMFHRFYGTVTLTMISQRLTHF